MDHCHAATWQWKRKAKTALRSESLCSPLKEARVLLAAVRAAKEGDVRIADAEARLTQCEWALDQRVAPKQRVIVYDGTTGKTPRCR